MMKLLIVDDEPIIRSGIRGIIDWEQYGYEICGEAEDGPSAVEAILNNKPDLVLLDLHLPGFSGINVIKKIKALEKEEKTGFLIPHFLILSGYSEFEYAKEAINLEVDGYITKPIDENILTERIISIAKKIKRKDPMEIRRIQFLEIMEGTYNEDIYETFYFESGHVQVAFVSEREPLPETIKLQQKVKSFFHNNLNRLFQYKNFNIILFENVPESTAKDMTEKLYDYLEKSQSYCVITLGSCCPEDGKGTGIRKSCYEAEELMKNIFFCRGKKILSYEANINNKNTTPYHDIEEEAKKICSYIQAIDNIMIDKYFKNLEAGLINSGKNPHEIRQDCITLMIEVRRNILHKVPALKENLGTGKETLNAIMNNRYLEVIIDVMTEACLCISDCLPLLSADSGLQRVISYVNNNYSEDINLDFLAELFHYNCAYLGKRFKEFTGKSFHTYLDILRINAAKEFLRSTDMKVYEISSAVGYSNTDYFYSKFKKYVGESPLIYKKIKLD